MEYIPVTLFPEDENINIRSEGNLNQSLIADSNTQNESKSLQKEWVDYVFEGFQVYSVNNGIYENRSLLNNEMDVPIELNIENGRDFSFKHSDKLEGIDSDNSKLKNTNKDSKLIELNSDKIQEDYLKEDFDEDFENDDETIVKPDNIFNGISIVEDNRVIRCAQITPIKMANNIEIESDSMESHIGVDFPRQINLSPINPLEKNKNKKETEIKILNDKLSNQKYRNKIILEENKKLIEIINIFKVIQKIEVSESDVIQNSEKNITEEFKSVLKIEKDKEIKNLDINIEGTKIFNHKASNSIGLQNNVNNKIVTFINTNSIKQNEYSNYYRKINNRHKTKQRKGEGLPDRKSFINHDSDLKQNNYSKIGFSKRVTESKDSINEATVESIGMNTPNCKDHMEHDNVETVDQDKNTPSEFENNMESIVSTLERYKEMNDRLIGLLKIDDISIKIDSERRKRDVKIWKKFWRV